ncbi:hypothetical protein BB559_006025 [Furculomyces boomerangus]|uniref:Uncharacterized protein n=1 Tax=Furculomyces boomerangus TaxID=61424 RepID=A0A2T9Y1A9_9FUNG|nr:hypothetical protein BB559_006665 [Furculomyces boomerangus]PVU87521.1 hypothetical protein BB559_006025 [Furculomyces boomerangus]
MFNEIVPERDSQRIQRSSLGYSQSIRMKSLLNGTRTRISESDTRTTNKSSAISPSIKSSNNILKSIYKSEKNNSIVNESKNNANTTPISRNDSELYTNNYSFDGIEYSNINDIITRDTPHSSSRLSIFTNNSIQQLDKLNTSAFGKEGNKEQTIIKTQNPNTPKHPSPTNSPCGTLYWCRISPMGNIPPKLKSSTLVAYKDKYGISPKLLLFGGTNGESLSNRVYKFDVHTLVWRRVQTRGIVAPCLRSHAAAVNSNNEMFVFGGVGHNKNDIRKQAVISNRLLVFDIANSHWVEPKTVKDLPECRRSHACFFYKNDLELDESYYIFGGGNGKVALGDLYKFEIVKRNPIVVKPTLVETKGTIPQPRGYHSCTVVGDKMVLYGGSDGSCHFEEVFVLDLKSMTWSKFPLNHPNPRLGHSAVLLGPYLFIIWGNNGSEYLDSIQVLDLEKMIWVYPEISAHGNIRRGYHTTALVDNRIFSFGGSDGSKAFNDTSVLELGTFGFVGNRHKFDIKTVDSLD